MNIVLALSYVTIIGVWVAAQVVPIPYVVNLLLLVMSILYVACHWSLILLEEQAIVKAAVESGNETDISSETLGKEEAMQLPIVGSLSLFSIYLAFKFFDKELVNLLISFYFGMVGCAALTVTFAPVLAAIFPKGLKDKTLKKEIQLKHPFPSFIAGNSPWEIKIDASLPEICSFLASSVFSAIYFKKKHWAMNNVIGICFCLQGIERFSLGTYKTGAILLIGLFFYDIFWVFGTEVMVTVAKNLDGPIKLLFPRSLIPNPETNKIETSLLGLGDIVVPGFFLSLLLRFDAFNANLPCLSQKDPKMDIHASFSKPYFYTGMMGYFIGMGLTMFVMIKFEAAQPALLYLVPGCVGSSLLCAIVKGETDKLFAYSEEQEDLETKGKDD